MIKLEICRGTNTKFNEDHMYVIHNSKGSHIPTVFSKDLHYEVSPVCKMINRTDDRLILGYTYSDMISPIYEGHAIDFMITNTLYADNYKQLKQFKERIGLIRRVVHRSRNYLPLLDWDTFNYFIKINDQPCLLIFNDSENDIVLDINPTIREELHDILLLRHLGDNMEAAYLIQLAEKIRINEEYITTEDLLSLDIPTDDKEYANKIPLVLGVPDELMFPSGDTKIITDEVAKFVKGMTKLQDNLMTATIFDLLWLFYTNTDK